MVFCGIPSKACHECRARRTRCNEAKPSCAQCIRTGRTCAYRDLASFMFRNENDKLARQDNSLSKTSPSSSCTSRSSVRIQDHQFIQSYPPSPTSFMSLDSSSEDNEAICHVLHNYVSRERLPTTSKGFFDYLPELLGASTSTRYSYLHDAVVALGLAGIANQHHSEPDETMQRANLKYNTAVRRVSQSLGNAEAATRDEILVAVIILGLFESNASDKPRSMKSWMQHIKGAFCLFRLRDEEQLETPFGGRLLQQMRNQFVRTCIQRRISVPTEIERWSRIAIEHESPEFATATNLSFVITRFCDLRASMTHFRDFGDPIRVVTEAMVIDSLLQDWADNVTPEYKFTTIKLFTLSDEVFGDLYDVYQNLFIASTWNNYRSMRIVLHELLIEQLLYICTEIELTSNSNTTYPLPTIDLDLRTFYLDQIATSRSLIKDLTTDICASVPFFFNFHTQNIYNLWTRPEVQSHAGNLLMWPLYAVIVAGHVPKPMVTWVVGVLRRISSELGVRHASALAEVCEKSCEVVWDESERARANEGWVVERVCGKEFSGIERVSLNCEDGKEDRWNVCTRGLLRVDVDE